MNKMFNIFKNNRIRHIGENVDLVERYRVSENTSFDGIPTVYYDIYLHDTDYKVGKCDIRLKLDERMYYYGHVGYSIYPQYQGHHYAYYACLILFKIAKEEFNMDELIITCNPDNVASYKTLKKLNGELIEVAQIPEEHELYRQGEKYKCVFKYRIEL